MRNTLTITDNRTGTEHEIPITNSTIRAVDLRQIKVDLDEFGMMSYDPAFLNTAACQSRITFIDGDKGVLLYRGYPIEQLAEHSTFVETAYLLLNGETAAKARNAMVRLVDQGKVRPCKCGGKRRYAKAELDRYILDETERYGDLST